MKNKKTFDNHILYLGITLMIIGYAGLITTILSPETMFNILKFIGL